MNRRNDSNVSLEDFVMASTFRTNSWLAYVEQRRARLADFRPSTSNLVDYSSQSSSDFDTRSTVSESTITSVEDVIVIPQSNYRQAQRVSNRTTTKKPKVIDVITLDDDSDSDIIPIELAEAPQQARQICDKTIDLDSINETIELDSNMESTSQPLYSNVSSPSIVQTNDTLEILGVTRSDDFVPEAEDMETKPRIDEGYFRGPYNKRMVVIDQDESDEADDVIQIDDDDEEGPKAQRSPSNPLVSTLCPIL
ncbi:hypothetical protein M3Y98_01026300 [Aphelenchoides besseyi]|nr:hypothetical protein M3Y98_01026300 [Aphelenchoides besseyi]KAI6210020.1 hypothetical protein M3Y96_00282700 [Aphelenchoides besseyi]